MAYSPLYSSDDPLFKAYGIAFYLVGGAIALFIIMTVAERKAEKAGAKLLLAAGSLILLVAPPVADWGQARWEVAVRDHQEVTADMHFRVHYNAPDQFIPPMRNVQVEVRDRHVHLAMEFDPVADGGQTGSEEDFQDRLLAWLSQEMYNLSDYAKLSVLSVRVTYLDQVYVLEDLPLKDSTGKPLRESDEFASNPSILLSKMKVLPQAGGPETP
ncbi:hypothetical protein FE782_10495 [Paenibacillus antri]|uniref:Uncharacterized protein n=1 Tax=Paenibacillus antri TaxID=2582848 RepID=A0A5R9GG79_9BACL|nr:hypothetical protein [Paenibacillus antri]TLS52388.1 hypothetical protein FE782_10495 [Paenibacillus antri]